MMSERIEDAAAIRNLSPERHLPFQSIFLDGCERIFVAGVFAHFVYVMLPNFAATLDVSAVLLVLSETLPFVYIVVRSPSITLSQRPLDWAVGIMGTIAPLFVTPAAVPAPFVPPLLSLMAMIGGIGLQISAKLMLGRSFGVVAANRGVKVLGPYRFVRHPMYAGYMLTHVGFLLAAPSLHNSVFYFFAAAFQIARIFREERVLKRDANYRGFVANVRYRLVPGIF